MDALATVCSRNTNVRNGGTVNKLFAPTCTSVESENVNFGLGVDALSPYFLGTRTLEMGVRFTSHWLLLVPLLNLKTT